MIVYSSVGRNDKSASEQDGEDAMRRGGEETRGMTKEL
jgi:hypothetical protein